MALVADRDGFGISISIGFFFLMVFYYVTM